MKIVSLQPSVSIILDRLGCLDSLVACTRYCLEAVPTLRERSLPIVHDSWSTRAEELLPVHADLIIASVPYRQESLTAILKSGCPVLALSPRTLDDIFQDIRLIAAVVYASNRGEALIAVMQQAIADVKKHTENVLDRPLVHCEEWGKPLIRSQLWVKELVEIAGGEFLGEPGSTTSAETVADADPDVIVAAWCGAGNRVPLERIITQRSWQGLRAVKSRRVYCIADELLNTPAPNLIDGLRALAQILHPDLFGTLTESSGRQIAPFPPLSV